MGPLVCGLISRLSLRSQELSACSDQDGHDWQSYWFRDTLKGSLLSLAGSAFEATLQHGRCFRILLFFPVALTFGRWLFPH